MRRLDVAAKALSPHAPEASASPETSLAVNVELVEPLPLLVTETVE